MDRFNSINGEPTMYAETGINNVIGSVAYDSERNYSFVQIGEQRFLPIEYVRQLESKNALLVEALEIVKDYICECYPNLCECKEMVRDIAKEALEKMNGTKRD